MEEMKLGERLKEKFQTQAEKVKSLKVNYNP